MMGTNSRSGSASRCMLWHAPGTTLPADLVASLERRDVLISSCSSAYAALSWATLMERENDERTDTPAERDSLILVMVAPRRLAKPAEFVDAVRRYAPRTACWWYDASANPRLRAVVDDDVDAWLDAGVRAGQPVVIRPQAEERPRLKLSGGGEELGSEGPQTRDTGKNVGMPHTPSEGKHRAAE